ncbi:MAG: class I SAM-dependent methyltransferase, partial [Patescibacteria group bacterium]
MEKDLWTLKIYTPDGFVKEDIFSGIKVLDVGCGQRKLLGSVGMDIVKNSSADIVHDMNKSPWPFSDGGFDLVFMNHALEHADDVLQILGEAWRVTKSGGRLVIQVPHFRAVDAFVDPTHQHFFASYSMDYFLEGTKLSDYNYVNFKFRKLGFWYGWPHPSKNPVRQMIKTFIHRCPIFY